MPSSVGISRRNHIISRVRRSIRVLLISEPSLGNIRSQECKVDLLGVVGVEDEGIGGAGDVGDLGYGADRGIEDVVVVCCQLSGGDGS